MGGKGGKLKYLTSFIQLVEEREKAELLQLEGRNRADEGRRGLGPIPG